MFQFTHPIRGATNLYFENCRTAISIPAPREGCDRHCGNFEISIHVPHVGYDHGLMVYSRGTCISTHVPLAGYDGCFIHQGHGRPYFNSRTLRGVRRDEESAFSVSEVFQLTYPLRGTTHGSQVLIIDPKFQLTYPLRGATGRLGQTATVAIFQLTYPLRGATCGSYQMVILASRFQLPHPCRVRPGPSDCFP